MTWLRRWHCGLLLAAGWLSSASAAAPQAQWRFNVYLDDQDIGYHDFSLSRTADGERLRSEARFTVRLLMIPVYRYVHDAVEYWNGACLQRIDATTDDNGERLSVQGRAEDSAFLVTTDSGRQVLSGCVMSFAYWDTRILNAKRLLNAQNGEYLDVAVTPLGAETIRLGDRTVAAQHYRLTGKDLGIDLWYSEDRQWLALQSTTPSGRTLSYRRQVSDAQ
jgi:hypothetical protein